MTRHQAMQMYLLRVNPSIVVANRSCNLESIRRPLISPREYLVELA